MSDLYVISGATGMTGSELSKAIVQNGDCVIGFDNFFASSDSSIKEIKNHPNFTFFNYDLNNISHMQHIENLVKKLKGNYAKAIFINCAAVVHTEHFYNPNATFNTNVIGMKSFLDMAVRQGADTYINCSTSEIYSMQSFKEGGVKELDFIVMSTAEHSQRTSYAAGKLLTEFFLAKEVAEGKIRGCSIRFANVYSNAELYPKHIIPHIITSLKKGNTVTLLQNAKTTRRTFLHNFDSCSGVLALISSRDSLDGSIYNIATSEEIAILDLVALIAKKMGKDSYDIQFKDSRANDPERRVLNIDKILSKTNWKPKVSLEQGIEMCLSELK